MKYNQMEHQKNQNHGIERRYTDDLSELDIQLQQQTSDVSITEMMQETEQLEKAIKSIDKDPEDITREDENDGK